MRKARLYMLDTAILEDCNPRRFSRIFSTTMSTEFAAVGMTMRTGKREIDRTKGSPSWPTVGAVTPSGDEIMPFVDTVTPRPEGVPLDARGPPLLIHVPHGESRSY